MSTIEFNRTPIVVGQSIEDPSDEVIKNTLALWNCDLDTAVKYGGELTRAALGAMDLRGDRKHIIVDTKTHMLMPGFYPGIPGWHTDGVPRGPERNPAAKADPDIFAQEEMESEAPRFHLLVTGTVCPTMFDLTPNRKLSVADSPDPSLYKIITEQMNNNSGGIKYETHPSTVYEWDWWQLHTAQAAKAHGWRFLIRVTETDHFEPQTDLSKIIRTQQQVYVPEAFGW